MFNLGLYFQTQDLTKNKTKVLLNLGSKKFCDSDYGGLFMEKCKRLPR